MNLKDKKKLIFLDIDGTLINDSKKITQFTLNEIKHIKNNFEAKFILTSSRPPHSILKLSKILDITDPIIAYNGSYIYSIDSGKSIFSEEFDIEILKEIQDNLKEINKDYFLGVYYEDQWDVNKINYWCLREIRGTNIWPNSATLDQIYVKTNKIHKIVVRGGSNTLNFILNKIQNLTEKYDVIIHQMNSTFFEITASKSSKEKGVKFVSSLYSEDYEIIAIGDNVNDIGMLKIADYSIAMDNSPESVKEIANEITLSNNEDGVGYILKKLFTQ